MPHNRFYIDSPLTPDAELLLAGEEAHHLTRVMRKQKGEIVELVNGRNQIAQAMILASEKKGVFLKLQSIEERSPPECSLVICQALPRLNRLDLIVEKGTELGMTALWLFPGERSEKKEMSATQLKRLIHISIAAMKQCGRLDLPELIFKPPLAKWTHFECPAYFGATEPQAPSFLSVYQKEYRALFFVGPESGLSEVEILHLNQLNAKGVRLHSNILRTDTASLVALSLISADLGT